MQIVAKRILNVDLYLDQFQENEHVFVSKEISHENYKQLERIGFEIPVQNGDTVLPKAIGPVSRFNANGKYKILKDLPKERRFIRQIYWQTKDWHGNEHEGYSDLYRECYQRELISPPSMELTVTENGEKILLLAPALRKKDQHSIAIKHTINLFLEIFGECELLTDNFIPKIKCETIKLNWKLLPEGESPWENVSEIVSASTARLGEKSRQIILSRQTFILGLGPNRRYFGNGGFSDYLAYEFTDKNLVILESIRFGNAIYVFKKDWREVSKLSKAEILNGNLCYARVIHSDGWMDKVNSILKIPTAAE